MPMIKRLVEPSDVARSSDGQIPSSIRNELEYVANNTQANLIRQLSSLSKHAEDMFRELFDEASMIFNRTSHLQHKVDALKDSVRQFDPNQVVVKLTDITKRKPYKSDYHTDQQICTRDSMPCSLKHMYDQCKTTPRLDKFDRFRNDSMPSIKMYTNPEYFMQLWVESLQKNVENTKRHGHKVKKHGPSKKTRQRELKEVQDRNKKYEEKSQGVEFVPEAVSTPSQRAQMKRQTSSHQHQTSNDAVGHISPNQNRASRPAPSPPTQVAAPYRQPSISDMPDVGQGYRQSDVQGHLAMDTNRQSTMTTSPSLNRMTVPPPPPPPTDFNHQQDLLPPPPSPPENTSYEIVPPPPMMHYDIAHVRAPSPPPPLDNEKYMPGVAPAPPPLVMSNGDMSMSSNGEMARSPPSAAMVPPPPPPPPPALSTGAPPPPPPAATPLTTSESLLSGDLLKRGAASLKPRPVQEVEPVRDERSDLLKQIRLGIQLKQREERKVENRELDSKKLGGTFDVQSIMDKVQEMRRVMENSDDSDSDDWDDDWDSS